jgi:hypothetical protein
VVRNNIERKNMIIKRNMMAVVMAGNLLGHADAGMVNFEAGIPLDGAVNIRNGIGGSPMPTPTPSWTSATAISPTPWPVSVALNGVQVTPTPTPTPYPTLMPMDADRENAIEELVLSEAPFGTAARNLDESISDELDGDGTIADGDADEREGIRLMTFRYSDDFNDGLGLVIHLKTIADDLIEMGYEEGKARGIAKKVCRVLNMQHPESPYRYVRIPTFYQGSRVLKGNVPLRPGDLMTKAYLEIFGKNPVFSQDSDGALFLVSLEDPDSIARVPVIHLRDTIRKCEEFGADTDLAEIQAVKMHDQIAGDGKDARDHYHRSPISYRLQIENREYDVQRGDLVWKPSPGSAFSNIIYLEGDQNQTSSFFAWQQVQNWFRQALEWREE